MTVSFKNRIESLDLLKGLVMVIMALDHVRDYFHVDAFYYDPLDPAQTSMFLYFTRWITNFCAPTFCFLAGISAFLSGRRKTKAELSAFLLKRGLWLVFLEMSVVNFAWYFDIHFKTPGLLVIWSLGISMIVLAALVHLPRTGILIFSCVVIFSHNLLDNIHFEGNMLWSIIHDARLFNISDNVKLYIDYPLVPWIAVMSLGYCFGSLYNKSFDAKKRKKILTAIGVSALILFFLLRWINVYGNLTEWISYDSFSKSLMSFLNVSKYPPSLLFLLITLGPALIFLANTENWKGRVVAFFSTFGRVPFFYYILHLFLIHIMALIAAQLTGFGWQKMILDDWVIVVPELKGYGFNLGVVYLLWAGVILLLYPVCKRFDSYKTRHKDKWWLSYL